MKYTQKKLNVHGKRKKLASPNAKDTNMLVFLALGNAKVLSFALGDAKVPNANDFASQWNIGFSLAISVFKSISIVIRGTGSVRFEFT